MVVHMDSDAPLEDSVHKTSRKDKKKYVIVKNHIRELPIDDHTEFPCLLSQDNSQGNEKSKKKHKKSFKQKRPLFHTEASTSGNEVSKSDLEELRAVYKKCKAVIDKIETKYGHLLDLEGAYNSTQEHNLTNSSTEEDCHCTANTKIVFNDEGQQVPIQTDLENHVCPKKLKRNREHVDNRVAVEYEERNISLPDDLKSLTNILKDSEIEKSYRNQVIKKLKSLKDEHINEIRFNRPSLIEKLKTKADSQEVFEFNGANLFTLPGYPDWK